MTESARPRLPFSSWGNRMMAFVIDIMPNFVLWYIAGLFRTTAVTFLLGAVSLGWIAWTRWYQAGTTGQSLGKRVRRIALIGLSTEEPIGIVKAFARDLAHTLDTVFCFIGFLFPLWDSRRQTFADKLCGTVVIDLGEDR
jgi:uncharacterized RDD family membrane protein YckC